MDKENMETLMERVFGKKTPEEIEIENQIEVIRKEREEANEDEKWEKRLNPLYEKLMELSRERAKNRVRLRRKIEPSQKLTEEEIVARIKERSEKQKQSVSGKLGALIDAYNALSSDEKRIFMRELFDDFHMDGAEPQFTKPLPKEKTGKFLEYLVQCVIDFIIYEGIEEVDEVRFQVDGLKHSIAEGMWTPSSDASIHVYGTEPLSEDDTLMFQRVKLGECY